MKYNKIFIAATVVLMSVGCVKEQGDVLADAPRIIADLDEPETRTCIDASFDAQGTLPMLWMPSDEVGVFTSDGNLNVRYTNDEKSANIPNASFSATAAATGSINAVYYPYSADNNGKSATALVGTIPAEQVMGQTIAGDYKYGTLKGVTEDGGHKFKFHNLFSLIRFNIDATDTPLAGQTLETITLTVTHDGAASPLTGGFTFSALDGTYAPEETSDVLTTTWNNILEGTLSSFASAFPTIRKGDKLNFEIKAGDYVATLTVTSKADFAPGTYYTFPLTLSKFSATALKIKKVVRGNFTATTLNVDGLPEKVKAFGFIPYTINEGAPGADGTKNIGSYLTNNGCDFVGCSEDFNYHSELASAMSGFTWGTLNKETIPTSVSSLSIHVDTDGLSFATRNSTCSFSDEKIVTFPTSIVAGGLTSGANSCVDKGFRHYVVTMKDGVKFDVIITHMNTWSDSGSDHINAQYGQLQYIAEYINSIRSNRPIIFMGDTNCRYTRHDFKTYFWDVLDQDLEVSDPWVDFHRGGIYPTYGSGVKSLMIRANFKGDTKNDIVCSDDQRGEVVDKIIYINVPGATTRISATESYNDVANYTASTTDVTYSGVTTEDSNGNIATNQTVSYTKNVGYSDHFPVVAKFSYESLVDVK